MTDNSLVSRQALIKANHGSLATGRDDASALAAATELEVLAQQYLLSLQCGGPVLLSDAAIQRCDQPICDRLSPQYGLLNPLLP